MKSHKAPWGMSLIIVSSLTTIVCGGVVIGLLVSGRGGLHWAVWMPIVLLAGSALFTIRGFTVTPGAVLVHRLFWTTRLPLAGLQSAQFEPDAMRRSIRLFGNGGLFSFTGLFRNKALGRYRAFVTDLHRTVVLRFPGSTVVVSPSAPEEFVRDIGALGRAD